MVRLAIADTGIGMEESFSTRNEPIEEKGAALIRRAVTTPISSKRPFGYGLCRVNEIVNRLGGGLFIRSECSSVAVVNKGQRCGTFLKDELPHFRGTQIAITLISG